MLVVPCGGLSPIQSTMSSGPSKAAKIPQERLQKLLKYAGYCSVAGLVSCSRCSVQVGSPEAEDLAFNADAVIVTLTDGLVDAKGVVNGALGVLPQHGACGVPDDGRCYSVTAGCR